MSTKVFTTKSIGSANNIHIDEKKEIKKIEKMLEKYGFDSEEVVDKAYDVFDKLFRIDFYSKNKSTEKDKFYITVWGTDKNKRTLKNKKININKYRD